MAAGEATAQGGALRLLRQASAMLAGGSDRTTVLDGCMRAVVESLGASFARVWLLEPANGTLRLVASAGRYTHLDGAHGLIPVGAFKIGRIASRRAPHVTNDVPHDVEISDPEWAAREHMVGFAGYPLVADDRLLGVMGVFSGSEIADEHTEALAALADSIALGLRRIDAEEARRSQAEITELVARIGGLIAGSQGLAGTVQAATDAATRATGAQLGAFFYNGASEESGTDQRIFELYSVSGADKDDFSRFPMPKVTPVFAPTFEGTGIVRSDDITVDGRYGRVGPYFGMPPGHPEIRSYMAVPVFSRDDGTIGGMLFGHRLPGVFDERAERIAVGIASQAGLAVESASVYEREHGRAISLQRSLLPHDVARIPGLDVVVRYQPHGAGVEVGGDWYEATMLYDGRLALSVGDAMGHDLTAASAMTRVRHVIRAYALDGREPASVLQATDRLLGHIGYLHLTTALHAQLDLGSGRLVVASAGHPPALVVPPSGPSSYLDLAPGPPLATGLPATYDQSVHVLETGSTIVMYTDGLVERRDSTIPHGMHRLQQIADATGGGSAGGLADALIAELTPGASDDVALLVVRVPPREVGSERAVGGAGFRVAG